ncbi:MAG: RusA family crossover junction endodeoxyribonuclease [Flavobacteriales bacterium]|nr:RusA family crossover junction endodeoxyribonuclease [Flavobacteriales bacterium]
MTLHLAPVPAARPKMGRGRTYYPANYSRFKAAAAHVVRAEAMRVGINRPYCGPLRVAVVLYAERPKTTKLPMPKPDVDNYAKAVLDCCNGTIWDDDWQILDLYVAKQWADPGQPGYIELFLTKAENTDVRLPSWVEGAASTSPLPTVRKF